MRKAGLVVWAIVFVLAGTWYGLRTGELPVRTVVAGDTALHVPECGHDWDDSVAVDIIRDIIDVPEFHDCQRLVEKVGDRYQYTALAAVFARSTLGALVDTLGAVQVTSSGGLGGTTTRDSAGLPVPVEVSPATAAAAAVVYADAPYDRLGIEKGLNCLYVWRYQTGTPPVTAWEARMVPKGTDLTCPTLQRTLLPNGKDLEVKSFTSVPGFPDADDYPDVARWDWDAEHDGQYIGIKCGAAWCEVGDKGFTPSLPMPDVEKANPKYARVLAIKGWHDRQMLAKREGAGLVPSGVEGIIWPDPELGDRGNDDYEDWVPSANVVLQAPDTDDEVVDTYKEKYNFERTSFSKPVRMEIRRFKQENAGDGTPKPDVWTVNVKRHRWLFLHDHKKRDLEYRSVGAGFTPNYKVPGVARWRWLTNDEGSWTRCSEGCCEMSF
jgi:hypothetical protein